ncbi:MAG: acyl CoA:acetate/3-ketoacid CoA transferase [Firmicutes bacterium]|nr:acyl CoA:acetate/3-ketoacid CoA transferase [Bacillota bacterium]
MGIKFKTAKEAMQTIPNNAVVATGGFVGICVPEELEIELEKRYIETKQPKGLTLVYAAGQGDGKEKGLNHLGHEGLVTKVIGGHWGLVPKLQKLALENKLEAYNLPQGVISHMFRDIAAGKPGTLTHVGLKTFVDPRLEGGKINDVTKEEIVNLMEIDNEEYLYYKTFPVDVALLRGTYADENGNISMEEEAVPLESLSIAAACKNSGGKVIVQVKKVVKAGSLDPKLIKIPGIYVDTVVEIEKEENHMQTFSEMYNSSYTGNTVVPTNKNKPLALNAKKIIARRAAMELIPNAIVNLGIGVPELVATVANEEGIGDEMILTVEAGPIGGVPAGGLSFGASTNPQVILDQPYQFDFYDGGGLDLAFLGLAQCDKDGNINVSKFGPKVAGCGGFINITQNAQKVIYCGTFTAGGLKVEANNGELSIKNEGKIKKFVNEVEQVTFSGKYAAEVGQPVLYVTERAVFELRKEGLVLTEIASGVDLQTEVLDLIEFEVKIADDLKKMDSRIFKSEDMNLVIK